MKFSFILLTWNRANLLETCLTELLKSISDHKDVEIIIMDNNSSDNTRIIMEKFAKENKNIICKYLKKNKGLSSYKKLFRMAKGKYIVELDDDVLKFPPRLEMIFEQYFEIYTDYGYLALDVVQDEFTNGAKHKPEKYSEDIRGQKIVQEGPTGGWCAGIRRSDFKKIKWSFYFKKLDFNNSEDAVIKSLVHKKLKLRSGIIKNHICFHASGPYYSKLFGSLDRDIEKYRNSGLLDFVETYNSYK